MGDGRHKQSFSSARCRSKRVAALSHDSTGLASIAIFFFPGPTYPASSSATVSLGQRYAKPSDKRTIKQPSQNGHAAPSLWLGLFASRTSVEESVAMSTATPRRRNSGMPCSKRPYPERSFELRPGASAAPRSRGFFKSMMGTSSCTSDRIGPMPFITIIEGLKFWRSIIAGLEIVQERS